MSAEAPRRFYERAGVREAAGGFGVALDTFALKTPKGRAFVAPTLALAEAVADEWNAQGDRIAHASMPLTRLSFVALDQTPEQRDALADYVSKYAETDLVCHRAKSPAALIARQAALWEPIRAWGAAALGVDLPCVAGVIAAAAPADALARLRAAALALDDFRLTGLAHGVGLAGSALIGFALLQGRLDAASAFAAAALDDLWSLETWGEDAEARARLEGQRAEIADLERFLAALA